MARKSKSEAVTCEEPKKPTVCAVKFKLEDLRPVEPLTDNQVRFFKSYDQGDYFVALHGVAGTGKAQPLGCKVLTPAGWKKMGDIFEGDQVITPKGTVTTVEGVFPQGQKETYKVEFHDGSSTRCCKEHLWNVHIRKRARKYEYKTVDTESLINLLNNPYISNIAIDLIEPLEMTNVVLPMDPYVLGALIGDGGFTHNHISFSTKDDQMIQMMQEKLIDNYQLKLRSKYNYNLVKVDKGGNNDYHYVLSKLGLLNKKSDLKFIPEAYKNSSPNQKRELVRGLMDTDGTVGKRGNISYTTVSKQLAEDVQDILWSLGATCTITSRYSHYKKDDIIVPCKLAYTLHIAYNNPKELFGLERKKERARECFGDGRFNLRRRLVNIAPYGEEDCQCIMVKDEDQLYITDDYIITHNTFIAMHKAIQEVLTKGNLYHKVIVVRSAVQSRDQGFLPGGLDEKMSEYEQPYIQIAHSLFGRKDAWNILKGMERVEFVSTSFLRGSTYDNCVIIFDECQNANWEELSTVITRVGKNSKIIFCGDYRQNDLIRNRNDVSGIKKFLEVALLMPSHTRIEFTVDDIVRSSLVKDWVIACLEYEDNHNDC